MSGETKEPSTGKPGVEGRSKLLSCLDIVAKLAGSFAIVWVAYTANAYQSDMSRLSRENQNRLTSITLQSQREQAESRLRSTMFSTLIGPIAGPGQSGDLRADREALLVELLALNFHENFELKPLMEDVDGKLANRGNGSSDLRRSLQSIARRVADRQIAAINWGWHGRELEVNSCQTYLLTVTLREDDGPGQDSSCDLHLKFTDTASLESPDKTYSLQVAAAHPDWEGQTVNLTVTVTRMNEDLQTRNIPLPQYEFTLTWFDLPLTDNTLLSDGNRFAINLKLFDRDSKTISMRVVWFPKDYFTARERPLNYAELQRLLNPEEPTETAPTRTGAFQWLKSHLFPWPH